MLIALTGTNGAGKGTVSEYLASKHGFTAFSTREFIVQEIQRRGLEINRDTMRLVGDDIRMTHESGYMTQMLLGEFLEGDKGDAVIESINVTFDEFVQHEKNEYKSDNPKEMSVLDVMQMAERTLQNNGSKKELFEKIEVALYEK